MIIGWQETLWTPVCLTGDSEWQLYSCPNLHEKLLQTVAVGALQHLLLYFYETEPNTEPESPEGGRCPLTSVVCFIRRENMICSSDRKPWGPTDRWRTMFQTYSQLFLTSRPLQIFFCGVFFLLWISEKGDSVMNCPISKQNEPGRYGVYDYISVPST